MQPQRPKSHAGDTAGAKIQTSSGRILFAGHGDQGLGCRWWTDTGQHIQHVLPVSSEQVSLAEVAPDLVMNGRSGRNPWKPHRTSWTVQRRRLTAPYKCPVKEDNNEMFNRNGILTG